MAALDEYLDYTGLQYYHGRAELVFAAKDELPANTSDLTNDGDDGTSPFATEDYVDTNAGKIDSISVNGTPQTIDANKNVDLDVPVDLSDLTNTGNDPYAQMSDVSAAVVGALKPKGSVAFASLPALTAANVNTLYNVTDSFTTTSDFVEGSGKTFPGGTEVGIINDGTDAVPVYKYSVYSGFVDLSDYWAKTELVAITTAQIDALFASA